jgi:hypothetical protein
MAKRQTGQQIWPGDTVVVQRGVTDFECTVLEVYGPDDNLHYYCSVPLHGPDGDVIAEVEISFPSRRVRLPDAAPVAAALLTGTPAPPCGDGPQVSATLEV